MLDTLRGGQRWITTLIVGSIGIVFVLFLGLQGPLTRSQGHAVVTVGPYSFGAREFERARARREAMLQEQLGEQYDARALSDTLDQLTARELVDRALLALEGEQLGLTVSRKEIERLVLDDPGFRDESGKFNLEAFEGWTQYEYGSQTAFIEERRLAILSYKMLQVLHGQPQVSSAEAKTAVSRDLEEVQIAFVSFGATGDTANAEPPDAEAVKKALAERSADLHALYEERSGVYNIPEKIRARHILFAVDSSADAAASAAVQAEAEQALKSLRGGADFESLATQRSDDPGSKTRGGDLGLFGRGQMVPAFDEAAFALQEPGQISEVVRTPYGFHLIKLEERQPAITRSYDEVSEELARELLTREAGKARAQAQADKLAAAVRSGKTLEEAARAAELPIQRSGWLRRRPDGYIPDLGAAQDVLAAAFAVDVGRSLPRVFEVGDQLVMIQILDRKSGAADQVDTLVEARQQQLLEEKRDARSSAWLEARRGELIASNGLQVNLENLGRPAPTKPPR